MYTLLQEEIESKWKHKSFQVFRGGNAVSIKSDWFQNGLIKDRL